jgi:hypothetical protein
MCPIYGQRWIFCQPAGQQAQSMAMAFAFEYRLIEMSGLLCHNYCNILWVTFMKGS